MEAKRRKSIERMIRRKLNLHSAIQFLILSTVPILERVWLVISGAKAVTVSTYSVFERSDPMDKCMLIAQKDQMVNELGYLSRFLPEEDMDTEYEACECGNHHILITSRKLVRVDHNSSLNRQVSDQLDEKDRIDNERQSL